MKPKCLEIPYEHFLVLNNKREVIYFNTKLYRSYLQVFRKKLELNTPIGELIPQNTSIDLDVFFTREPLVTRILHLPEKGLELEILIHHPNPNDQHSVYIVELRNLTAVKDQVASNDAMNKYSFLTSHVLRAPLSTILSLSDVHSNPQLQSYDSMEIRELLINIQKQAEKLDEIILTINNLLCDDGYQEEFKNQPLSKKVSTIVLVDDDLLTNKIHQRLISQYFPDINLVAFLSPKLALEYVEKSSPDLVLLDINMPEINGWEFLQYMEDKNVHLEVIVLSSSIDIKDKRYAKRFKAVKQFLEKPLNYDKIQFLVN